MFSFPLYERLKEATPEFEEVAAFQAGGNRLECPAAGSRQRRQPLRSEYVTGNYFSTLGVRPFGGRLITPEDDQPSSPPVAVISHQAWQTNYGADPSVVGSTFVVEGHPFTIIGVTPPGFFGDTLRSDPPEIWIPVQQEPLIDGDSALLHQSIGAWLRVIGRLRPGASTAGMAPRVTGILRQWMQHESGYPPNWMSDIVQMLPKQVINVVPAGAGVAEMKEEYGRSLQILLAVCGMVAADCMCERGQPAAGSRRCASNANRPADRCGRQQAANRWQALLESILLAVAGGVAGLVVAVAAARLLLVLAFRSSHFLPIDPLPSPIVLVFAFAVALLTGIIFGAAPAWFATRTDPVEALRGSGRSTDGPLRLRSQGAAHRAGCPIGGIGRRSDHAGAKSQQAGAPEPRVPHGRARGDFVEPAAGHLHAAQAASALSPAGAIHERAARSERFWSRLVQPADGQLGRNDSGVRPSRAEDERRVRRLLGSRERGLSSELRHHAWSAGETLLLPTTRATAPVAIVNEAFVKRFFKSDEDPLGQHFGLDEPENVGTFRIVGIVRDAKFAGFAMAKPARPMFYVPLAQNVDYKGGVMKRVELESHFIGAMMLVTNLSPGVLEPPLKRILAGADPNLTINSVRTMEQQVSLTFDQERAVSSLAGLFGAVALLLAAVGLYGVTAYTVAQRTNEIGIRMALGADRASVVRYVLRGAFVRVAVGLALGLPLAIAAGRLISSQLYDVPFWDPMALTLAAAALAICSLVAALIPATVAASISPMTALRTE